MRASRSLVWTASNNSIILAAADVHVFLAYLWSTYLALINSFLTVLWGKRHISKDKGHIFCLTWRQDCFRAYCCKYSTYMSLDGLGFGVGEGRFPSMISLKLLFPTFLASCGWSSKSQDEIMILLTSITAFTCPQRWDKCLHSKIMHFEWLSYVLVLQKRCHSLSYIFIQKDLPRVLRSLTCPVPWIEYERCGPPSHGGCRSIRCKSVCLSW